MWHRSLSLTGLQWNLDAFANFTFGESLKESQGKNPRGRGNCKATEVCGLSFLLLLLSGLPAQHPTVCWVAHNSTAECLERFLESRQVQNMFLMKQQDLTDSIFLKDYQRLWACCETRGWRPSTFNPCKCNTLSEVLCPKQSNCGLWQKMIKKRREQTSLPGMFRGDCQ